MLKSHKLYLIKMQRSEGVGNDEASDNEAASEQSDAHSQLTEMEKSILDQFTRRDNRVIMSSYMSMIARIKVKYVTLDGSLVESFNKALESICDKGLLTAEFSESDITYSLPAEESDNEQEKPQANDDDEEGSYPYPRTFELDHMVITLLSRASGGLTMEDIVDELDSDDLSISNSIDRIGDKVKTEVENGMTYYYILHDEEKHMEKSSGIGLAIMEVIKVSGTQTLDQIIRKVQSISRNSRQQIHQAVNRLLESNELETADGNITVYRIPQDSDEDQNELHMDTVGHIFDVILESGPLTSEDVHRKVKAVSKVKTYVSTNLRLLLKGGRLMLNDGLYHFPQGSDEDQGRISIKVICRLLFNEDAYNYLI